MRCDTEGAHSRRGGPLVGGCFVGSAKELLICGRLSEVENNNWRRSQ